MRFCETHKIKYCTNPACDAGRYDCPGCIKDFEAHEKTSGRVRADMTERELIQDIFHSQSELRRFGWHPINEPPPKNQEQIQILELQSTGIHNGYVEGDWPNQRFWVTDDNDTYPSRPYLWRPLLRNEN